MGKARLKAIGQIKRDAETAPIIVEGYYEVIKELLSAVLLRQGFRSDNHECLISFFRNSFLEYEAEALLIHELKNVRNRINYDGFFVGIGYLSQNEAGFNRIIRILEDVLA
jgi:hypothetical protein